jgi:hypothetical protein
MRDPGSVEGLVRNLTKTTDASPNMLLMALGEGGNHYEAPPSELLRTASGLETRGFAKPMPAQTACQSNSRVQIRHAQLFKSIPGRQMSDAGNRRPPAYEPTCLHVVWFAGKLLAHGESAALFLAREEPPT